MKNSEKQNTKYDKEKIYKMQLTAIKCLTKFSKAYYAREKCETASTSKCFGI